MLAIVFLIVVVCLIYLLCTVVVPQPFGIVNEAVIAIDDEGVNEQAFTIELTVQRYKKKSIPTRVQTNNWMI